jgi:hypothetical protein
VLLIVLGVLSRLFILSLLRRISASPSRDVTPSMLPGTPWFTVDSDRQALKIIVVATYGSVLLGMLLFLVGLLV